MRPMPTAFALFLLAGTSSAFAGERDCRPFEANGAKAARRPAGCELPAKPDAGRLKQQNGFVDLGNGTQVKVSGRVRVDVGRRD